MDKHRLHFFFWLLFLIATLLPLGEAQALRVTIKRVLFEGTRRAESIVLINNGPEEVTYRLSLGKVRMNEGSGVSHLDSDDPAVDLAWAGDMIRYAPRRVTIPPGGSQQVRLMLQRPADLAEGEYRAHLQIEPEAQAPAAPAGGSTANGVAAQIKMLTGVSLPVIVRHGKLTATVALTNAQIRRTDGKTRLDLTLTRTGNRSVFGNITFACHDNIFQQVKGIAIYTERDQRTLGFTLQDMPENCPAITIAYTADSEDSLFKGGVMARAVVNMP